MGQISFPSGMPEIHTLTHVYTVWDWCLKRISLIIIFFSRIQTSQAIFQYHKFGVQKSKYSKVFLNFCNVVFQEWPKLDVNYNLKLHINRNGKFITDVPVAVWKYAHVHLIVHDVEIFSIFWHDPLVFNSLSLQRDHSTDTWHSRGLDGRLTKCHLNFCFAFKILLLILLDVKSHLKKSKARL